MNKVIFACEWQRNKAKTWSGTCYSLHNALQKYYDIDDLSLSSFESECTPLLAYFYLLTFQTIKERLFSKIGFSDFDMGKLKIFSRMAANKIAESHCNTIIQFSEFLNDSKVKSFIYQDLNVGYVRKMHDNMPEIFRVSGYQHLRKNAIYKREKFQLDFYSHAAGIFTMGNWLAKELVENYGIPQDKVFHVGGGYNVDSLKIDVSGKQGNKILFIGRDFVRKNGPLVIEAFRISKKKRPDLELYIAGPQKPESHDDGIIWLGDLNKAELIRYLNLCDVFCMPSLFEAYGLVFPEALTFGLPCIGRDAYEMPYFIEEGKTGYLLHSQNAQELSDLMLKLICNEEIKRNVISKRDWYIQEYSWNTVAKRMYDIIEAKSSK